MDRKGIEEITAVQRVGLGVAPGHRHPANFLAPMAYNVISDIVMANVSMVVDETPIDPFLRSSKVQRTPPKHNESLSPS